jgi:hypothetical protein
MSLIYDYILGKLRVKDVTDLTTVNSRITTLENNEYKILYFQAISATTGTITKPTNSTILLDQFYSGGDAIVETLSNGQPTGQSPLTGGGAVVSVTSFDVNGNYVLSGTPSAFDVALVYILTIKAVDYANLNVANIMAMEEILITKTSQLINDGDDGNPFISLNDLPSNLILYATTVASDIPTYVKLVSSITDIDYNTVAVDVSTGSITTTNQFISSLITLPNLIVGNPGVINISTIGNIRRTAGTGDAEFYFEVYKRTIGGVETLITTSGSTPPVFNGTYAEFSATALWNDGIFLATDRIVLKFYGSKIGGGSNPTYDFQFGGITPVRSLVPIPLTVSPFITLDEVADVTITTPVNNDLLAYESSTSLWKNKTSSDLGLVSELITTNRQVASYVLALSDKNKLIEMNVGSANDLTIPLDSSISFAIGTQILLSQYGAGQTTVLPTGGVTLRSASGKTKLTSQYSGATLIKIATDEWYLFGDITA